jgi:hypothetical protein
LTQVHKALKEYVCKVRGPGSKVCDHDVEFIQNNYAALEPYRDPADGIKLAVNITD